MKKTLSVIGLAVVLTACDSGRDSEPEAPAAAAAPASVLTGAVQVQNLDADEAALLLKTNDAVVVLDVRTPQEYSAGRIRGATNVDFRGGDFKTQLEALDKSKPYLVHCAVGGRSAKARDLMEKMGFRSIYHLDDGIKGWAAAGQPVEQ